MHYRPFDPWVEVGGEILHADCCDASLSRVGLCGGGALGWGGDDFDFLAAFAAAEQIYGVEQTRFALVGLLLIGGTGGAVCTRGGGCVVGWYDDACDCGGCAGCFGPGSDMFG